MAEKQAGYRVARPANDNRPRRDAAERLRDTVLTVVVILLIAGATGSFHVQAALP